MNICGLILAAGGSSRLGKPKQLVQTAGKTLLQQTIANAQAIGLQQVYVVLGAQLEDIQTSIQDLPVTIINNEHWQEGIGSSISTGISTIVENKEFDAVLIMLCDQLRVNTCHLKALINAYLNKEASIIATSYGEQTGVPVIFDKEHFPALAMLSGDKGAKKVIDQSDSLFSISFEEAIIDIDTPEDLEKNGLI